MQRAVQTPPEGARWNKSFIGDHLVNLFNTPVFSKDGAMPLRKPLISKRDARNSAVAAQLARQPFYSLIGHFSKKTKNRAMSLQFWTS